jgi:hypothetical protein
MNRDTPLAADVRFRHNTAQLQPYDLSPRRRLAVRKTLVAALVECAELPFRPKTRRFLNGLSSDELQFIAAFYGACIVESTLRTGPPEFEVEARLAHRFADRQSADRDHKMILLREYLSRAGTAFRRSHLHASRN